MHRMSLRVVQKGRLRYTAGFLISILCACFDPFFPPTGTPDRAPSLRSTPDGVFTQLINSYESQDLLLYENLFPVAKTFRFYVAPNFVTSYNSGTRPYVNPPEVADTLLIYINAYPYYYYWTQDVEIQSHKNLFTKAASINFTQKPSMQYRAILDAKGDTTNYEVLMTNGEIVIVTTSPADEYTIEIEKQVFLLERDTDKLWVIRKWYDFGSR